MDFTFKFRLDVTVNAKQMYTEKLTTLDLWLIGCSLYFLFGFFCHWGKPLILLLHSPYNDFSCSNKLLFFQMFLKYLTMSHKCISLHQKIGSFIQDIIIPPLAFFVHCKQVYIISIVYASIRILIVFDPKMHDSNKICVFFFLFLCFCVYVVWLNQKKLLETWKS